MHHAITLEALRVLEAIKQNGSFAGAAKALFKVPSALTYTVNKLESDLQVELFNRTGQRAVLTEAGLMLLKEGEALLDAASRLEQRVKQMESGWETKITIAKDTVIHNQLVLDVIDKFCQLEKQVEVSLFEEALGGSWDALQSQRSDIAIGVTGELPKGQYTMHQIGEVEFVFAVAKTHPLANHIGTLDESLISQYPAIIVADSARYLPQRSSGLFQSKQVIRVHNMLTKIRAQASGMGVGFLPLHLIKNELESGELVAKATSLHRPPIQTFIAWRKGNKGKALGWFIEQCKLQQWL
jgi:DNA-binding transcriptional LysR family regulator